MELTILGIGSIDDFLQKSERLFLKCIVAPAVLVIDDGQAHRHDMLLAEAL